MGDVYVFRDRLAFRTPSTPSYSGPINIELTFQGCADAGLCYPPETVSLDASESSPPTAFADWDAADQALSGAKGSDDQQISQTAGTNSNTEFSAPQSEDSRFSALLGSASLPLALGLFLSLDWALLSRPAYYRWCLFCLQLS